MQLYYYQDPHGNFGDDLNPWLWSRLIPDLLDGAGRTLFLGIGTILNENVPRSPGKVVFGSGVGYGALPKLDEKWKFYSVRGKRSAQAFGLPLEKGVTDPAILVRRILPPLDPSDRRGVVFVPHHESMARADAQRVDLAAASEAAGVRLLSPSAGLEPALESLRSARLVLAEAMHGAIVADALRVPWVSVRLYGHILKPKWLDWTESLGVRYEPAQFDLAAQSQGAPGLAEFLQRQAREGQPELSTDAVSNARLDRLLDLLEDLRRDHLEGCLPEGEPAAATVIKAGRVVHSTSWWHRLYRALRKIDEAVPAGEPFLLADEGQWTIDSPQLKARARAFPSCGGIFSGPPEDDAQALDELAREVNAGVRYLVIGWPSFWWLDHYPRFYQYLITNYRRPDSGDDFIVFDLRETPKPNSTGPARAGCGV